MNAKAIPYWKTNNSITLTYNGGTKVIAKDDSRFDQVVAAIREARWADIPSIVEPEAALKRAGFEVDEGIISLKGEAMPSGLNARIMEYKKDGLPFNSLLKFWENLQQNPSFNSRQQLFQFLENKGHPITEDGCFIGYRGVTEDFKDKHTRKWNNAPGAVCEMPRDQVDDNPNNTCSHGLHVGGFSYSKDFGPKLVIVKVNPRDVVAVPTDYNGQKMRVCRFEVLEEVKNVIENPVVNEKGGTELALPKDDSPLIETELEPTEVKTFKLARKHEMSPSEKRAHKRRYANNHAKRGPGGQFVAKKGKRK